MEEKEHDYIGKNSEWITWGLVGCAVFMLIVLTWQQVKLKKWSKILRASKVRILELEAKTSSSRLEGMKEVADLVQTKNKVEVQKINDELKKLEDKKKTIKSDIDRMNPEELLKSFQEEGL
jgi:hypothetical protein